MAIGSGFPAGDWLFGAIPWMMLGNKGYKNVKNGLAIYLIIFQDSLRFS